MNTLHEKEIIAQVLQGEQHAFAIIVDRYKDKVFALVFRMMRQRETAEEVTQDIFVKVFQNLPSFKEQSAFSTWLYRIAYNTTISEIRKRKMIFQALSEHYFVSLQDDSNDKETEEQLIHELDRQVSALPPEEAALITLFYHDDKSMEEVSRITGISLSNVKVKIHRTRNKLRKQLKGVLHDGEQ